MKIAISAESAVDLPKNLKEIRRKIGVIFDNPDNLNSLKEETWSSVITTGLEVESS